jgi:molybdopterin/thiamine biosynthesis adenylyltransferase
MDAVVHRHIPITRDGVNIVIVGIGGTGGYVANHTIKLFGGIRNDLKPRLSLTLIDPDTFEVKNLGRQLCVESDIGRNKAEVIAQRYTAAYNVTASPVSFIPAPVREETDIINLVNLAYTNIFVDCLDKTVPRGVIHKALEKVFKARRDISLYLISSGNEEYNGQATWGAAIKVENKVKSFDPKVSYASNPYTFSVPMPYKKMPRMMDPEVDKAEAALSCGERAARNVQTMVANNTAANMTFNFINSFVRCFAAGIAGDTLPDQTVAQVSFDAAKNLYKSEFLTEAYLKGELF